MKILLTGNINLHTLQICVVSKCSKTGCESVCEWIAEFFEIHNNKCIHHAFKICIYKNKKLVSKYHDKQTHEAYDRNDVYCGVIPCQTILSSLYKS